MKQTTVFETRCSQ